MRCLTAEGQVLTHLGYPPDDGDRADMHALFARVRRRTRARLRGRRSRRGPRRAAQRPRGDGRRPVPLVGRRLSLAGQRAVGGRRDPRDVLAGVGVTPRRVAHLERRRDRSAARSRARRTYARGRATTSIPRRLPSSTARTSIHACRVVGSAACSTTRRSQRRLGSATPTCASTSSSTTPAARRSGSTSAGARRRRS